MPDLAPDPDNPNTWLWNPAGATLEEACAAVDCGAGALAIAGGTEVFSLFLKIGYDIFYLARAEQVRLPGGVPVFCQGRFGQSPEEVLRDAGLKPAESRWLDDEVSLVRVDRLRSGFEAPSHGLEQRAPGDRMSARGALPSTRPDLSLGKPVLGRRRADLPASSRLPGLPDRAPMRLWMSG